MSLVTIPVSVVVPSASVITSWPVVGSNDVTVPAVPVDPGVVGVVVPGAVKLPNLCVRACGRT